MKKLCNQIPYKTGSIFIGLLLLLTACSKAPDFAYADGSDGRFSDFTDKVVILNYWAAWCKPCRDEIPEFNHFAEKHPEIAVIGINYDKPEASVLNQQITDFAIAFPVTTASFHTQYGFDYPKALPTTVIISKTGEVRHVLIGPQTEQSISEALNTL
jgi:thiol-disulfide isomerase/thioredoxin